MGISWPDKYDVLGIRVSAADYEGLSDVIIGAARNECTGTVTALAVHGLVIASRDSTFGAKINTFDVVTPDGQPVRWALKWLHKIVLRDRVYGPFLMLRLCQEAERTGVGVYLYGSHPDVVKRLRLNLCNEFPGIRIVGCEPSVFRPLLPTEDAELVKRINSSGAGLVFLGLGCPRQEEFAYDHRDKVHAVQICVGAAFDFHSGNKQMAPGWMQAKGLEWLYRLLQEPGRLWRRYLFTNSLFLVKLLLQIINQRRRIFPRAVKMN
jgi:exopolysaccharide biosynthesis WecB/TagA/CpsF family protein